MLHLALDETVQLLCLALLLVSSGTHVLADRGSGGSCWTHMSSVPRDLLLSHLTPHDSTSLSRSISGP